jgi:hypothetical protein
MWKIGEFSFPPLEKFSHFFPEQFSIIELIFDDMMENWQLTLLKGGLGIRFWIAFDE